MKHSCGNYIDHSLGHITNLLSQLEKQLNLQLQAQDMIQKQLQEVEQKSLHEAALGGTATGGVGGGSGSLSKAQLESLEKILLLKYVQPQNKLIQELQATVQVQERRWIDKNKEERLLLDDIDSQLTTRFERFCMDLEAKFERRTQEQQLESQYKYQ